MSKEKTIILTPKEHIKRQSMWAGKKKKINGLIHILNTDIKKFEISHEQFSPALYKTIDEDWSDGDDENYTEECLNIHENERRLLQLAQ